MMKYAIIGFGCAGYHAAEAIRSIDKEGIIDVWADHTEAPYNPMLTTYHAGGKIDREAMFPFGSMDEIKEKLKLNVVSTCGVRKIDCRTRTVEDCSGNAKSYDRIMISSGARAFVPPIKGTDGPDVFLMRTQHDADALLERMEINKPATAVVVGASMVGIKVAELLNNYGISTVLADMAPYLFPLAAYPNVGKAISERVEKQGIKLLFGAGLSSITDDNGTHAAHFSDGSEIKADIILLCIGTRTNLGFLDPEQISINRGVVVNNMMQTSVPGIYAAGDCCEGNDIQDNSNKIIGLWANAGYQGRCAGVNMAGGNESFRGNILHNITRFMGMDFVGLGDNRLEGKALISGDLNDGGLYVEARMQGGKPVSVNILDNYRISGLIKNYFVKLLEGETEEITALQRGILKQEGLSADFLDELEGKA